MKNISMMILVIMFAVASVFAGLAWYNNICIALQWNPISGHSQAYHGPLSWLDWCGVDFSTVSTFIPFFGIVLITVGLAKILLSAKSYEISEHYPFFKSYNAFTIALGLIGTVWGLIMIGYYEPGRVQMSDLVLCLRTALYSTLVALIWVFLFVIPTKTVMRHLYLKVGGKMTSNGLDVVTPLKELGEASSGTSKCLGITTNSAKRFNQQLVTIKTELSKIGELFRQFRESFDVDIIITLKEVCLDIRESFNQIRCGYEEYKKTAGEQQKTLQQFAEQLEKDRQLRKELMTLLQQVEKEKDTANMWANKAVSEKIFAELGMKAAEQQTAKAWSWLDKVKRIVANLT